MLKLKMPSWRTALATRLGICVVLCANYSCSNSKEMVSHDPFAHDNPSAHLAAQENTLGNHKTLETAGIPFEKQQVAQSQVPPQAVASLPVQQTAQQSAETDGKVHLKSEWPAISEQTVGYKAPEKSPYQEMPTASLPPGGYERPIGESEHWHQTAKKTPTQTTEKTEIVQTAYADQTKEPVYQSPFEPDADFTPAEPRERIETNHGGQYEENSGHATMACPPFPCQPACNPQACEACDPAFYPDEYICDGGDRKVPVHYSPGTREGLDTQDTIAEYQDDTGEHHMKPTNEVCVYAPRFGAVKSTTGSSVNLGIDKALGAYESVNGLAVNTRIKPNMEQQKEQINAAVVRSRASGLETEEVTLGVNQATTTVDHTKLENTNTDYGFTGQVNMDRWQTPVGFDGRQAAASWSREQSPVAVATDVGGTEVYSWFRPEELVGLEDKKRIGDLYVDKSADKRDAVTGDIITFTIRFRNTGERPLYNVQLIDNLTPRLEFIEGTATSDRNGRLVVEDNQEGSLILKWELSEEIEGNSGGTVTFQAKVR